MSDFVLHSEYRSPSRSFADLFSDPVRLVIVAIVWLAVGYGARSDNQSPIVIPFLEPITGMVLSPVDFLLLAAILLELVRRLILGDFWVSRSPVSKWVLAVGLVCVAYPFMAMVVTEGGFRIPLELTNMPFFVLLFFGYLFLFRRADVPMMMWMIVIAGAYKVMEGIAIYATVGLGWGLLTSWRDGLLMSMMVFGGILALVIRSDDDRTYRLVRRVLIVLLPFASVVFLASMRRSFIIGIVASLPFVIFLLKGMERKRAIAISVAVVFVSLGVLPLIATGMDERLGAVAAPTTEGSSAYRLLEVYSVSQMILERPFTGWPMGTNWVNQTSIEFDIVSGLVPHNIYLYTLWRGGILGAIAWIGMMAATLLMNIRTVRAAGTPTERFISLWLTATTLSLIIAGFASPLIADRLQLFLAFPFVMASLLPGAWKARAAR